MQVYYFTRTGRSKNIAEELAARCGAIAQRIEDGRNWSGAIGFIRACFMSGGKKSLPARYSQPADGPVVVVFPIWAGTFPPAVRSFIAAVGRARITAIPTSGGGTLQDRAGFARVIDLVGKEATLPEDVV